jgi:hypothetical protein
LPDEPESFAAIRNHPLGHRSGIWRFFSGKIGPEPRKLENAPFSIFALHSTEPRARAAPLLLSP